MLKVTRFALCLVVAGCASAEKKESSTAKPIVPSAVESDQSTARVRTIDLEGLQRSLGLDRSLRDLGYQEKIFNTCEAGFGYAKDNCRSQVFFSLNLRVQCRDTEGTTSEVVTASQVEPIANKQLRWELGKLTSITQTDAEGYAQIKGVDARSPRTARLKIAVGQQHVYMRAGEVTRIVTPANWCKRP